MKLQFVINKKRRSLISCSQCRRKKQKCDERKPSCTRCLVNQSECEYKRVAKPKKCNASLDQTNVFSIFGNDSQKRQVGLLEQESVTPVSRIPSPGEFDSLMLRLDELCGTTGVEEVQDYEQQYEPLEEVGEVGTVALEADGLIESEDNVEDKVSQNTTSTSLMPFKSSSLDLDLEFEALTIISTSENIKGDFTKYNKCYPMLLSLAYSDKAVMFTFAGWILSMKKEDAMADKFLKESENLFNSVESRLVSSRVSNEELMGVVVSQTCHALLASSRGDYRSWRNMFENIYKLFCLLGIDEVIELFKGNTFLCWVLGWFFYQDTFRLGRLSKKSVFGPLFSKNTYVKLIDAISRHKIEGQCPRYGCGPLTACCATLCIKMGEVNTLYDLYKVKLNELNSFNREKIEPVLNNTKISRSEQFEFLDSDVYQNYDRMRMHFYSWFDKKVNILEEKISQTEPNLDYVDAADRKGEQFCQFHDVLKNSVRIFLKMRLLNCSPTSFEIKILCTEIIDGIRKLVAWDLNNNLLLPFLIAGACVYEKDDRMMFEKAYEELKRYLKSENLTKAWNMIQSIWKSSANHYHENLADIISIIDSDVCVF